MLNLHIILFGEHHSMLLSYWSTVRWYNGTPLVGAHCYSFPIGPPYASIVEPHWLVQAVKAGGPGVNLMGNIHAFLPIVVRKC